MSLAGKEHGAASGNRIRNCPQMLAVIVHLAFAPQYVKVAHFREDFTTDFTDYTDKKSVRAAGYYP